MPQPSFGLPLPPGAIYEEGTLCAAGELQLAPALSQPTHQNLAFNTTRVDGHQMTMGSPADSEQFYERLTRVMFSTARRLDHPILSRACPVKEYMGNGLTQRTTIIMYQDVAWQSRAAGTGGRNPVSTARSVISTLTRVGGAVDISKEHMATPEGQEHVKMQLQQLKQGMVNSALVYALSGMVSSKVDVLATVLDNLQTNSGDRARARDMSSLRTQSMVGVVTRTTGALRRMAVWGNDLLKHYSQDTIKFWIMTSDTRNALQCRPSAPGVPEITIPITSTTYDHEAPAVASDGSEVIIAPVLPINMDGVIKQLLEVPGNVPSYVTLPPGAESVSVYNPSSHSKVAIHVKDALAADPLFLAKDAVARKFVAAFLAYFFFTPTPWGGGTGANTPGHVSERLPLHEAMYDREVVALGDGPLSYTPAGTNQNRGVATFLVGTARRAGNNAVVDGHVNGSGANDAGDDGADHPLALKNAFMRAGCVGTNNDVSNRAAMTNARRVLYTSMTNEELPGSRGTTASVDAVKDAGLLLLLLQYIFGSELGNDFFAIGMITDNHGVAAGDVMSAEVSYAAANMTTHVANAVKWAESISGLRPHASNLHVPTPPTADFINGNYIGSGWRCDTSQNNVLPLRLWTADTAKVSTSSCWALAQQLLARLDVSGQLAATVGAAPTYRPVIMDKVREALSTFKAPHPTFLDAGPVSAMLHEMEATDLIGTERKTDVALKYRLAVMQSWPAFIAAAKRGFAPVKMVLMRPTLIVRAHHVLGFSGRVGNLVVRLPTEMRNSDAVATTETSQVSVYMGLRMDFPDRMVRFPYALLLRDGFTINGQDYDTVRTLKYTSDFEAVVVNNLVEEVGTGPNGTTKPRGTFFAAGVLATASDDRPIGFRTDVLPGTSTASAVMTSVTPSSETHLQVSRVLSKTYDLLKEKVMKCPPGLVAITKWKERGLGSETAADPDTIFAQSESSWVSYAQRPKVFSAGHHFLGRNEALYEEYAQSGLPGGNGSESYPNTLRLV
jgi:hypothetical protein